MAASAHMFAGNPLLLEKRDRVTPSMLSQMLVTAERGRGGARVLPVKDGRPLVACSRVGADDGAEVEFGWELAWQSLAAFGLSPAVLEAMVGREGGAGGEGGSAAGDGEVGEALSDSQVQRVVDNLVYLGEKEGVPFFVAEASTALSLGGGEADAECGGASLDDASVLAHFSCPGPHTSLAFVDARVLMVGTDASNEAAREDLAIAGQGRALLEWHKTAKFCGRCGAPTLPVEAGVRRRCGACGARAYPRTDPVVIMLVVDEERDRVLLGRQGRFLSHMWSCLAGFMEPGESLEEAVRREVREEVGIQIGSVIYHSSQPWPVGSGQQACQVMVGFFAYAKSTDIVLDQKELDDAQWFSRAAVAEAMDRTDQQTVSRRKGSTMIPPLAQALKLNHSGAVTEIKTTSVSHQAAVGESPAGPGASGGGGGEGQSIGGSVGGVVSTEGLGDLQAKLKLQGGTRDGAKAGSGRAGSGGTSNIDLAKMVFPGPYAIAHHLISSWVREKPSQTLISKV